jgi:hypothetical protein
MGRRFGRRWSRRWVSDGSEMVSDGVEQIAKQHQQKQIFSSNLWSSRRVFVSGRMGHMAVQ